MLDENGNKKIALFGFSRLSLFPVLQNNTEGYKVGARFGLSWAQEMSKETDSSETKIYADDMLYANIKVFNGLNATITMVEMPLKTYETLGFGTYNEETRTLKWNPQGENKEYAATFRCKQLSGEYRMYSMFSFTPNELKESGIKTNGDGTQVVTFQLIGTFTPRKYDDLPGEIHDGADIEWLDTVDSVPDETE